MMRMTFYGYIGSEFDIRLLFYFIRHNNSSTERLVGWMEAFEDLFLGIIIFHGPYL